MEATGYVFRFDAFEFNLQRLELRYCDARVRADALVLRLLLAFLRNPGRVVTKEELVALVWEGRTVSDNSLTVAIARLRKVLNVSPSGRDLLTTVHGSGYRFSHNVQHWPQPDRVDPAVGPGSKVLQPHAAPCVGRSEILLQLREALHSTRQGAGQLVVLTGHAGIGKTRLAEELEREAVALGWPVAFGHCREHDDTPPLWPITETCRELLSKVAFSCEDRAHLVSLEPTLAQLLPGLSPTPQPPAVAAFMPPPPARKTPLWDGLTQLLGLASATHPLLLIIDDVHAADEASSEFLEYIAPRIKRRPILLVCTARPLLADKTPSALLAAVGHRNCVRITVGPLTPLDVDTSVSAVLDEAPAELRKSIYELSAGNPFYMVELTRESRQGGEHAALVTTPPTLDPASDDVLRCAALIGRSFSLPLLHAATERPHSELVSVLDNAAVRRIVEPTRNSQTTYRFVHEIVRERYLAALSPGERRHRHLRIAAALPGYPSSWAGAQTELAYHAYRALPLERRTA